MTNRFKNKISTHSLESKLENVDITIERKTSTHGHTAIKLLIQPTPTKEDDIKISCVIPYKNTPENTIQLDTSKIFSILKGAIVVGEQGELSNDDLKPYLIDCFQRELKDYLADPEFFSFLNPPTIFKLNQQKTKSNKFTPIHVDRDNEPPLKFDGLLLAHVNNSDIKNNGHWSELLLYKTDKNKYIGIHIEHTLWFNEKQVNHVAVLPTIDLVIDFFGYTEIAKELYQIANIDFSVSIAD